MALIFLYKSRGITKDLTIQDSAGVTIEPGDNDFIRVRIGREGKLDSAPLLTILSGTPTANGSTFSKNTPTAGKNRLRIDDADADLLPAGIYTMAVDLMDNADAQDWKNVSRQVVCVEDT